MTKDSNHTTITQDAPIDRNTPPTPGIVYGLPEDFPISEHGVDYHCVTETLLYRADAIMSVMRSSDTGLVNHNAVDAVHSLIIQAKNVLDAWHRVKAVQLKTNVEVKS